MRPAFAFVAGIGLGLLLGTKQGREQLERVKQWGSGVWEDPRVQDYVQTAQEQAVSFAKEQSSALKEQSAALRDKVNGPDAT